MKTLNLAKKNINLEDLLKIAVEGSVRILSPEGHSFILEVDDFGDEVKKLGKSKEFRRFLDKRSKEPATRSLEDYRRSLQ